MRRPEMKKWVWVQTITLFKKKTSQVSIHNKIHTDIRTRPNAQVIIQMYLFLEVATPREERVRWQACTSISNIRARTLEKIAAPENWPDKTIKSTWTISKSSIQSVLVPQEILVKTGSSLLNMLISTITQVGTTTRARVGVIARTFNLRYLIVLNFKMHQTKQRRWRRLTYLHLPREIKDLGLILKLSK